MEYNDGEFYTRRPGTPARVVQAFRADHDGYRDGTVIALGTCPTTTDGRDIMRVEFLGIPRERAGVAELELEADTLGQLLRALEQRFPSLGGLVEAGRLHSSCRANLNGDAFVSDPRTRLSAGDCVLILSADAGG